jgi:hypothetical protein
LFVSYLIFNVFHQQLGCRACAQCRMSKKAMELLEDAKKNNMPLDAFIYTATIDGMFIYEKKIHFHPVYVFSRFLKMEKI